MVYGLATPWQESKVGTSDLQIRRLWTCSSVGQSGGLISRRSWVQAPPGPPAILTGEMIYPVDVGVGVRVTLVQIGRQGLSEKLPHYSGI